MAVVYADSPAAAYQQAASRDQERVSNLLASIEANRRAQLAGWNANYQMASGRAIQDEARNRDAIALAQHIATLRAKDQEHQQNRQDQRGRDLLNLMLANRSYQLQERQLTQPTAKQQAETAELAKAEAERAGESQRLAQYLNERDALRNALKNLPGTPAQQSAISDEAAPLPSFMSRMTLIPWLTGQLGAQQRKGEEAIKGKIRSVVPQNLSPQFPASGSVGDYNTAATTAINQQLARLSDMIPSRGVDQLVRMDPSGRFVPLFGKQPQQTQQQAQRPVIDVETQVKPQLPQTPQFTRGQRVIQNGVVYVFDGQQFIEQ